MSAPRVTPRVAARQRIDYERVSRVFIQVPAPFWNPKGNPLAVATTDLPSARLWDITAGQNGLKRLVVSYTMADDAEKMGQLSPSGRGQQVLIDARKAFPHVEIKPVGTESHIWHKNRWARGAYVSTHPGEMTQYLPIVQQNHGNVYFAGHEYSGTTGWMQGAIGSALESTQLIIRSTPNPYGEALRFRCLEILEDLARLGQ